MALQSGSQARGTTFDGPWEDVNGRSSGAWTISAPNQRGDYEFFYVLNEFYKAVRSEKVTVR
jgi:hypothetical protein